MKQRLCWLLKKLHNIRTAGCFIWGKMRTVAQETAFQIALRNFSKVVGRRSVNMWFWWRGSSCNQAHIFCRRLLLVLWRFLLVMRRRCHHEGLWCLSAYEEMGLSRWLSGQESTYSAGDTGDVGLIPGSGRSPGGENGSPLQYLCLEWTEKPGEL